MQLGNVHVTLVMTDLLKKYVTLLQDPNADNSHVESRSQ